MRLKNLRFEPATLSVTRGETVRFHFVNEDTVLHDVFVGDAAAQAEHERQMRGGGGHAHGSDAVDVYPGRPESLTYTFDKAGTIEIGCHVEGHYPSGMRMTITVT